MEFLRLKNLNNTICCSVIFLIILSLLSLVYKILYFLSCLEKQSQTKYLEFNQCLKFIIFEIHH